MVFILEIKLNNGLFSALESMGDFLLIPKTNNIILHTDLSRTKVYNRIKKVSSEFDISLIKEGEIFNYPDVVKKWYLLDNLKEDIKNVNQKRIKEEALKRLSSFVDALEEELKNSEGKEVANCQIK